MMKIGFSIVSLALIISTAFSQKIQPTREEHAYAVGWGLFAEGQHQRACEEFERFLFEHPRSVKRADATFYSAECLFSLNQPTAASRRYEYFLLQYPESPHVDDALFRLGEIAYNDKKYKLAASTFKQLIDSHPESNLAGEAAHWVGESHFKLNEIREALKFYQVSYELYPRNRLAEQALYSVGWTYAQTGDYRNSLSSFQNFIGRYPESALTSTARVRIGECFYRLGHFDQVVEVLTNARARLAQERELAEADFLIGESYYNLGDYPNAIFAYEDFLKEHRDHQYATEVQYSLGWAYLHEQNYPKATEIFGEMANGTDALAHSALYRKGIAQKLGKQESDALTTFLVCSQSDGIYADNALYEAGLLHYEERRYTEAEACFTQLTRDFPSSDVLSQSYRMLGETNLALNEYTSARDAFRNVTLTKDAPTEVIEKSEYLEAWSLFKAKEYHEAAKEFDQFVAAFPQSNRIDDAYFWLAEAAYAAENSRQAAKAYSHIVDSLPKSAKYVEALYGLGWSTYRLGDFESAATVFERVMQAKSPQLLFDACLRHADCFFAMKSYKAAAGFYRAIQRQFENQQGVDYAYYQIAQCYAGAGEVDTALYAYSDFIATFPNSEFADDAMFGKGWVFYQQRDYKLAIRVFQSLAKLHPRSELIDRAYYFIGKSQHYLKRYEAALASYNKILFEVPSSPYVVDAVLDAQDCYRKLGKNGEAALIADEFIQRNPQSPSIQKLMVVKAGQSYARLEFDQAAEGYRLFIERFPDSELIPEAIYWLGKSYNSLRRTDEAANAFGTVVRDFPQHAFAPASMLEIGFAHAQRKEFVEAIAIYDKLQQRYPDSEFAVRAAYEKGMAYLEGEKLDQADAQFTLMAAAHKGHLYGDKSLIGLGTVRQKQQVYNEARRILSEVAARRSDEVGAEAQLRIGETLFLQLQYKEAITAFLRVKSVCPTSRENIARSYLRMGECFEKIRNIQKAQEAYRFVLRMHRDDEFAREAERKLRELLGV
jgi:tol-pal system protein YbgF